MKGMKLKKISNRKKCKFIFLIVFIYLVFAYTFYYSFKNNQVITNEEFIKFLINNSSSMIDNKEKLPVIVNKTMNYVMKVDFTKPDSLFNQSIIGYSEKEDDNTEDLEKLKQISSYISDPYKVDIKNPIIYIYNTHQLENYNSENLSIYGITPNVLMASYLLKEKLNSRGIPSIVEDMNMTEFLDLNGWNYASSYKASRIFMLDKQNTYPSLKYYIDIHRDSVGRDLTTIKIGNKKYARILFVIGLEHDNYKDNLKVTSELNQLFEENYPGLSRGIYKKEGPNVNGIYNQDISSKVMLIEVGGVDNTIEEVMNTISAISDILIKYIGDNH